MFLCEQRTEGILGYTDGLGQGMFGDGFGAWCRADEICFKTVAEGAEHCTLLLFAEGKEEPEKEILMTRIGNSAVFYSAVPRKEAEGLTTYLFATENGMVTDRYARGVSGKDTSESLREKFVR